MEHPVNEEAGLAEKRALTPEVWEGIRSRHSLVESAGQPTEAARAMAYLSHLDRRDLIAEVEKLRDALKTLYPGLVLDLRYADIDDDMDAMRSRIRTVEEALSP